MSTMSSHLDPERRAQLAKDKAEHPRLTEADLDARIAEKRQQDLDAAARSKRHADLVYGICEKLLILAAGACAGFALAALFKWVTP